MGAIGGIGAAGSIGATAGMGAAGSIGAYDAAAASPEAAATELDPTLSLRSAMSRAVSNTWFDPLEELRRRANKNACLLRRAIKQMCEQAPAGQREPATGREPVGPPAMPSAQVVTQVAAAYAASRPGGAAGS